MKFLKSIKKIEQKYDVFLIDQWGVIHDGFKKINKACEAIKYLKKKKKKILIISNSSQLSDYTKRNTLANLDINPKLFNKIITSGELFKHTVNKNNFFNKKNLNIYHISHIPNDSYLRKLKLKKNNDIKKSDLILASSIKPGESLKNYKKTLDFAIKKNIPMICTNPDKKVFDGNLKKIVNQVGILSSYYKKKKGKLLMYGKPYKEIFKFCLKSINFKRKSKVLLIGDSIENDIQGANKFGIDSTLILNGVLKKNFANSKNNEKKIIEKILKISKGKIKPTYFSWNLNI